MFSMTTQESTPSVADQGDSSENAQGLGATLRTLAGWARPFTGQILLIFVILLFEMGFSAAVPMSFKLLIDHALIGREQGWLYGVLVGLAAAAVLITGAGFARDYLYARVVARLLGNLRSLLFDRIQNLGMRFFSQTSSGDILVCFSGHLAAVESALTAAIPWAVLPGLEICSSVVLLFCLDWRLASIGMMVFPMTLIGPRAVSPRATQASYERRQDEGSVVSQVQENIAAKPVVVAFGLADVARGKFASCNTNLVTKSIRLGFLNALVERTANVGIVILQIVILGVGTLMAFDGLMSIGSLTAFQTLFLTLSYSLSYVTQYVPTLIQASGAIQHLNKLLDGQPSGSKSTPGALPFSGLNQSIEFRDINFSYDGKDLNLSGVNLSIAKGTSVAFVGSSGSGKSTMVNLLMGYYRPLSGNITIDGVDANRISEAGLRGQMSIVFQESFLFNTTIRENIRLGRLDATDQEIEEAAKAAEIHEVIRRLPEGYDTVVGERGGKLSGGQRQRIAVARAIIRKPAILALDEATSALDPVTEANLNQTLAQLSRGRTVVAVTHRLQSVVDYDRICVFDRGKLIEQGKHQELVERAGFYAKLWQKQMGFTISGDGDSAVVRPEKLREFPILSELPATLQAEMAKSFHSEQFAADRVVFEQDESGEKFYLIVRGKVAVQKRQPTGEQVRVAVLSDGDFFGEIALLRKEVRNATIKTLTPCLFLTLHRPQFIRVLDAVPDLMEKLLAVAELRS
jgi:ATP-binding cassette subfamily B protein